MLKAANSELCLLTEPCKKENCLGHLAIKQEALQSKMCKVEVLGSCTEHFLTEYDTTINDIF